MKFLFFLLFSTFAYSGPLVGEYKYCVLDGEDIEAYLNIVRFDKDTYGFQIIHNEFPVSFKLVLDGKKRVSKERISEMPFEYRAKYGQNLLKLVFRDPERGRAIGLNPKWVIQFNGLVASFVFDGDRLSCRMKPPCGRYPCREKR